MALVQHNNGRSDQASTLSSIKRIFIAQDGRLKAQYEDNTLLLVNSLGSAFIHCSPSGQKSRQLSEYVLSRYSIALCAALEFRNLHLDTPYYCKALLSAQQALFTVGYVMTSVLWPDSLQEASAKRLITLMETGQIAVQSMDATARIVMDAHSQPLRFAVCYPLLVEQDLQRGTYTYLWQTHSFTTHGCPERWRPAVVLAMAAAKAMAESGRGNNAQAHSPNHPAGAQYASHSFDPHDSTSASHHASPSNASSGHTAPSSEGMTPFGQVMCFPSTYGGSLFNGVPERTTALPKATSRSDDAGK